VEDLVTVQVRDRHLGSRNEEQVFPGDGVLLVLELGELRGPEHRRAVDGKRNPNLLIAVLRRVQVEHVGDQGADEPGAEATERDETRARHFCAASKIEDATPLGAGDLPVGPHAVGWPDRPPTADDAVCLLASGRDVRQRDVRKLSYERTERRLDVCALALESIELSAKHAPLLDEVAQRLATLLALPH